MATIDDPGLYVNHCERCSFSDIFVLDDSSLHGEDDGSADHASKRIVVRVGVTDDNNNDSCEALENIP
jgi:hypothetical protein